MSDQAEQQHNENEEREPIEDHESIEAYNYTYVPTVARIAVYDDMKMAPRVIEIQPAPTAEYIEKLADVIDEQKRRLGGTIPYSAIREVSENFIHARFTEVVVSILDGGNTIRFCDQGPGIHNKEKATLPGFTSATEPMKHYIRGVGSGLPLVKEYLDLSHGNITIEDNLNSGAVVTISLKDHPSEPPAQPGEEAAAQGAPQVDASAALPQGGASAPIPQASASMGAPQTGAPVPAPQAAVPMSVPQAVPPVQSPYPQQRVTTSPAPVVTQGWGYGQPAAYPVMPGYAAMPPQQMPAQAMPMPLLSEREKTALTVFAHEGALGVTDLSNIMGLAMSSTYALMDKMEESGLIERTKSKKRLLTDYGDAIYQQLKSME